MGAAMDALLEAQERTAAGEGPDRAAAAGMDEALHAERIQAWKLQAEAWLDEQPEGSLFTADDLVAAIGKPDLGGRNNAVGAWINAQQNRRRIEFTGRVSKSRRVEGHGNMQRLWRVKDGRAERAGGDAACLGPVGVSSSSPRRVGGDAGSAQPPQPHAGVSSSSPGSVLDEAPAMGPQPVVGVSSSTGLLPPLTAEEEEEHVLQMREHGLDLGLGDAPPGGTAEMGEQLGLLGTAGATAGGAYSGAA